MRHTSHLRRFIYSHHLFGGLRQSIGVLLPAIVLGGLFKLYDIGVVASMGALCVAIIDQPGGPRRYRFNEMIGGALLGTFTAFITGLSSNSVILLWLLVPTLTFFYSMLNVFGKRVGLIGFAALLLMALTMRFPMTPDEVLWHTLYTAGGAFFYFNFSNLFRKILLYREERRTLAMALFATANYVHKRAKFYDPHTDLDEAYRELMQVQATMSESHQATRDMVLRELPNKDHSYGDAHRIALLTIYVNMMSLLDLFVATHTDYVNLRKRMADSDFMFFARDALLKMAVNIENVALNVSRFKKTPAALNTKAELRALEYELERYKRSGLNTSEPETYGLLVQILRRLRNAEKTINHMAAQTRRPSQDLPIDQYLDKSLSRFLSRDDMRLKMFSSNLRWQSAHFRYAVRMSCATLLALAIPSLMAYLSPDTSLLSTLTSNSHWVILTALVIMKPGFALTKQRNLWRLGGTILGCTLTFALFQLSTNTELYFLVLLLAYILGTSLVHLNYLLSAVFNTIFVLISFQFMHTSSHFVIGERLMDTVLGCFIALVCSYVLPKWESSSMTGLAKEAIDANKKYLKSGLRYAELNRQYITLATAEEELAEADTKWRVARSDVHVAFSNFAAGFYRMMSEPVSRQQNVSLFNNLLIQNHVLASQITAAVPLLATLSEVPEGICTAITAIEKELDNQDGPTVGALETEDELAMLAYPLRQMIRATQLIRQDLRAITLSSGPPSPQQLELLQPTVPDEILETSQRTPQA